MKKIFLQYGTILAGVLLISSCYQDLDNTHSFNYPESKAPEYNAKKLSFTFEHDPRNKTDYLFLVTTNGAITYQEGKVGEAYKGSEKSYILITPTTPEFVGDISIKDTIANLGSFTVAFFMKSEQASKATGIFSISNTLKFWGNLDIFLDSHNVAGEGRFKVHLYNGTKEIWIEEKIPNTIDLWVHMAFRYDATTKTFSILREGEQVVSKELNFDNNIRFDNMGQFVIGALQFQTQPSLTASAKAQTWATNYSGLLDQFFFYNKALSNAKIKELANGGE